MITMSLLKTFWLSLIICVTREIAAVPQFSELDERPHGVLLMGNQIPYCVLVDEDGGIYMNNSEKDKKKRYCVVVKRDEDGSIEDVVEVSLEDAVRSALASE